MKSLAQQMQGVGEMRLFKNLKCHICDFFKLTRKVNRELMITLERFDDDSTDEEKELRTVTLNHSTNVTVSVLLAAASQRPKEAVTEDKESEKRVLKKRIEKERKLPRPKLIRPEKWKTVEPEEVAESAEVKEGAYRCMKIIQNGQLEKQLIFRFFHRRCNQESLNLFFAL